MKLSPKRDALKRTLKNSTMLILASKISACGGGSPSNTENHASNSFNEVSGTYGAETLRGTQGSDRIQALAGDDRIFSYGGADIISAGTGSNFIYAGPGDDEIHTSSLLDIIDGGIGNDTFISIGLLSGMPLKIDLAEGQYSQLSGPTSQLGELISIENVEVNSSQAVTVIGSTENNFIRTGEGDDIIKTGLGENTVESNGGNDAVYVSGSTAQISLGVGNDALVIETLTIGRFDGGAGSDTLWLSEISNPLEQITLDLSNRSIIVDSELITLNLVNFENVNYSGNLKVNLIGDKFSNLLEGGNANDTISGMGGSDILRGGLSSDTFVFRSEDHIGDAKHIDQIVDFQVGTAADVLQFTGDWNLSTTATRIQFFDLNQDGLKTFQDTSAVLVVTGADLLSVMGSPLQTLNSANGIQLAGNARLIEHDLLCVTLQDGDNYATVSVLHYDPITADFVSNNVVVQLNDIDSTQLGDIVSDNFNIA